MKELDGEIEGELKERESVGGSVGEKGCNYENG